MPPTPAHDAANPNLDDVIQSVTEQGTVVQSAVTLMNALSEKLHAAANDPAKVRQIADQLAGNSKSLADAITANTPAEPAAGGSAGRQNPGGPSSAPRRR